MNSRQAIFTAGLLLLALCPRYTRAGDVLLHADHHSPPGEACSTQRVVGLQLDYGLIVSNGDTNCAPRYYLFCRNEKRIVMTKNAKAFLAELDTLPDGATVDLVSKCTVPFYTQYGVGITNEYNSVITALHRKRARLVSSLEDDGRHTSFCYCGSRITILEKYEAEPQGGGSFASRCAVGSTHTLNVRRIGRDTML